MSMHLQFQNDCKQAVSTLQNLSNEELDRLMDDDEKISNILLTLDTSCLKDIEKYKENILEEIRIQADENIAREPELIEKRSKLQKSTEEGAEVSARVNEKAAKLKQLSGNLSLETALNLLQTATKEMEEESEQIAKKLLENEIDVDEFLDKFLTVRRLVHTRTVKAEKMSKLMAKGTTNYVNLPTTRPYPPANPVVPYPVGPLAMPMPGYNSYFQNHF